ncbi:MAG: HlyD family efflux transporter periplasmic adaptor subunit [Planctomycetota bacterium]
MKKYQEGRVQSPQRYRDVRTGGMAGALLICVILVGVVSAIGYKFFFGEEGIEAADLITATATKGPFDHIILEQGEIESSSNLNVTCQVSSRGMSGVTILWVIDEGTKVKAGDKLVEIDASHLELELKEKKIRVISAEAAVTTADASFEQSKIARKEYLEGTYKTERSALLSEKLLAEQDLNKAKLAQQSSLRLVAKGVLQLQQVEADTFAVRNAQERLNAAKQKLYVLETYTRDKMLVQFDSDIESADANLSAAKGELLEEQTELEEIEQQIENCIIYAPDDGVVVHANRYSSRGGSSEFVVEAGAQVRERQEIIKLPDPNAMQVECKVNESRITLIREGMAARISVDAIPGLTLTGRVKKVNRYPVPGSWYSSSIKEYATLVEIIDPPESIRTGMTAEVQIFVEQLDDAVQIPIQALYEHGDDNMYVLLQKGPEQFVTSKVDIGATNDTMSSITDGVDADDIVVLNLRDHLSLMDLPEVVRDDNSDMRDVAQEAPESSRGGWDGNPGGGNGGPGGGEGRRRGAGGGGGGMDVNAIVSQTMQAGDTDGDGIISAEELGAMDSQRAGMIKRADTNGDGNVTRAEIMNAMKQMSSRFGGGGGGRAGGGGPPGGGPPRGGGGRGQ